MNTIDRMTAVRDNANASSAAPCGTEWNLEALVRNHQAQLWRYARFLGASASQADDLVQETFLAVHRKPFEQRSAAATSAYLRTVVRRCLLMARRKEGRQVDLVCSENAMLLAEQVWAEKVADDHWDGYIELLIKCLSATTGRVRRALDLFYRDHQSRPQIAQQLGMKSDGVKTMLRRAREKLRDCIRRKLENDNGATP